jgi:hypothetical protein
VARWNIQKHPYYADCQLVFPNSHTRVCFKPIMDVSSY